MIARKVEAAKRFGRSHSKLSFDVDSISLTGLPELVSIEALVVQLSRGPKVCGCPYPTVCDAPAIFSLTHLYSQLCATEPAEPESYCIFPEGSSITWSGQHLQFVATLAASKTGKAFSDKIYKVTLIGLRPAAFGTTKKLQRE